MEKFAAVTLFPYSPLTALVISSTWPWPLNSVLGRFVRRMWYTSINGDFGGKFTTKRERSDPRKSTFLLRGPSVGRILFAPLNVRHHGQHREFLNPFNVLRSQE